MEHLIETNKKVISIPALEANPLVILNICIRVADMQPLFIYLNTSASTIPIYIKALFLPVLKPANNFLLLTFLICCVKLPKCNVKCFNFSFFPLFVHEFMKYMLAWEVEIFTASRPVLGSKKCLPLLITCSSVSYGCQEQSAWVSVQSGSLYTQDLLSIGV